MRFENIRVEPSPKGLRPHRCVLTTNSAFFFADLLLEGRAPLSAYTLFDLGTVVESIVLYDKLYTLPGELLQKTNLAKKLTHEGILEEVPVDGSFVSILFSVLRQRYSEKERKELAAMVATTLPVSPATALHGMRVMDKYIADAVWRTPTGWATGRDWYYISLNEETYKIKFWEDGHGTLGLNKSGSQSSSSNRNIKWSIQDEIVSEIVVRGEMYIMIASVLGMDYHPDVIRIPITMHRLRQTAAINSAIAHTIRNLERKQTDVREKVKKFYGIQDFEVELPAFLSIILSESRKPSDIIDKAIDLRRSRYARSFREWMAKIDRAGTPGGFDRKLLTDSYHSLKSSIEPSSLLTSARLSCVPSCVSSLDINPRTLRVDVTSMAAWGMKNLSAYFRKPYVAFLPRLRNKLEGLRSNSRNLEQVFGSRLDEGQERLFSEISSKVELLYST